MDRRRALEKRPPNSKRPKRPSIRLGAAEHEIPAIDPKGIVTTVDRSRIKAQLLFLKTVAQEAPQVLQSLRENVYPHFPAALEKWRTTGLPKARTIWGQFQASMETKDLAEAIINWAEEFRLDADWIKDAAISQMVCWHKGWPETSEDEDDHWKIRLAFPDLPALTFGPVDYQPTAETADHFRDRVMKAFLQVLNEYIDHVHRYYERRGYPKHKTVEMREGEHFLWLVLYQVKGWSYGRIASEFRRERKSVEEAVKKLAALVDLPLRPPSKPGRPEGSRDPPRIRPI